MNDFSVYDHVVVKKNNAGSVLGRVALGAGILILAAGLLILGLSLKLFPVFLGLTVALVFFGVLWLRKYARIEYEYEIVGSEVTFSEIFNRRARHEIAFFDIRQCRRIIPADHPEAKALEGTLYSAISGPDAPNPYLVAFDNKQGKPTVILFEMTGKALAIFRAFNPSATVMTKIED